MFPLALQLGVLDTTIIVVYLAALLLVGWYFALRTPMIFKAKLNRSTETQ